MTKPLVIAPDKIKKFFPEYNPDKAEGVHRTSAKLADKWFEQAVKNIPADVILLAGGAASGKTEYLSEYLRHFGEEGGVFYDGTLPTFQGASIKIKNALKCERNVEVHIVVPDDLERSFTAFLNRVRKYSTRHFYRTHCQSRQTVLEIAENYDITLRIIESRYSKSGLTMEFEEIEFESKQAQIDYLKTIQYNENEIIQIVNQLK